MQKNYNEIIAENVETINQMRLSILKALPEIVEREQDQEYIRTLVKTELTQFSIRTMSLAIDSLLRDKELQDIDRQLLECIKTYHQYHIKACQTKPQEKLNTTKIDEYCTLFSLSNSKKTSKDLCDKLKTKYEKLENNTLKIQSGNLQSILESNKKNIKNYIQDKSLQFLLIQMLDFTTEQNDQFRLLVPSNIDLPVIKKIDARAAEKENSSINRKTYSSTAELSYMYYYNPTTLLEIYKIEPDDIHNQEEKLRDLCISIYNSLIEKQSTGLFGKEFIFNLEIQARSSKIRKIGDNIKAELLKIPQNQNNDTINLIELIFTPSTLEITSLQEAIHNVLLQKDQTLKNQNFEYNILLIIQKYYTCYKQIGDNKETGDLNDQDFLINPQSDLIQNDTTTINSVISSLYTEYQNVRAQKAQETLKRASDIIKDYQNNIECSKLNNNQKNLLIILTKLKKDEIKYLDSFLGSIQDIPSSIYQIQQVLHAQYGLLPIQSKANNSITYLCNIDDLALADQIDWDDLNGDKEVFPLLRSFSMHFTNKKIEYHKKNISEIGTKFILSLNLKNIKTKPQQKLEVDNFKLNVLHDPTSNTEFLIDYWIEAIKNVQDKATEQYKSALQDLLQYYIYYKNLADGKLETECTEADFICKNIEQLQDRQNWKSLQEEVEKVKREKWIKRDENIKKFIQKNIQAIEESDLVEEEKELLKALISFRHNNWSSLMLKIKEIFKDSQYKQILNIMLYNNYVRNSIRKNPHWQYDYFIELEEQDLTISDQWLNSEKIKTTLLNTLYRYKDIAEFSPTVFPNIRNALQKLNQFYQLQKLIEMRTKLRAIFTPPDQHPEEGKRKETLSKMFDHPIIISDLNQAIQNLKTRIGDSQEEQNVRKCLSLYYSSYERIVKNRHVDSFLTLDTAIEQIKDLDQSVKLDIFQSLYEEYNLVNQAHNHDLNNQLFKLFKELYTGNINFLKKSHLASEESELLQIFLTKEAGNLDIILETLDKIIEKLPENSKVIQVLKKIRFGYGNQNLYYTNSYKELQYLDYRPVSEIKKDLQLNLEDLKELSIQDQLFPAFKALLPELSNPKEEDKSQAREDFITRFQYAIQSYELYKVRAPIHNKLNPDNNEKLTATISSLLNHADRAKNFTFIESLIQSIDNILNSKIPMLKGWQEALTELKAYYECYKKSADTKSGDLPKLPELNFFNSDNPLENPEAFVNNLMEEYNKIEANKQKECYDHFTSLRNQNIQNIRDSRLEAQEKTLLINIICHPDSKSLATALKSVVKRKALQHLSFIYNMYAANAANGYVASSTEGNIKYSKINIQNDVISVEKLNNIKEGNKIPSILLDELKKLPNAGALTKETLSAVKEVKHLYQAKAEKNLRLIKQKFLDLFKGNDVKEMRQEIFGPNKTISSILTAINSIIEQQHHSDEEDLLLSDLEKYFDYYEKVANKNYMDINLEEFEIYSNPSKFQGINISDFMNNLHQHYQQENEKQRQVYEEVHNKNKQSFGKIGLQAKEQELFDIFFDLRIHNPAKLLYITKLLDNNNYHKINNNNYHKIKHMLTYNTEIREINRKPSLSYKYYNKKKWLYDITEKEARSLTQSLRNQSLFRILEEVQKILQEGESIPNKDNRDQESAKKLGMAIQSLKTFYAEQHVVTMNENLHNMLQTLKVALNPSNNSEEEIIWLLSPTKISNEKIKWLLDEPNSLNPKNGLRIDIYALKQVMKHFYETKLETSTILSAYSLTILPVVEFVVQYYELQYKQMIDNTLPEVGNQQYNPLPQKSIHLSKFNQEILWQFNNVIKEQYKITVKKMQEQERPDVENLLKRNNWQIQDSKFQEPEKALLKALISFQGDDADIQDVYKILSTQDTKNIASKIRCNQVLRSGFFDSETEKKMIEHANITAQDFNTLDIENKLLPQLLTLPLKEERFKELEGPVRDLQAFYQKINQDIKALPEISKKFQDILKSEDQEVNYLVQKIFAKDIVVSDLIETLSDYSDITQHFLVDFLLIYYERYPQTVDAKVIKSKDYVKEDDLIHQVKMNCNKMMNEEKKTLLQDLDAKYEAKKKENQTKISEALSKIWKDQQKIFSDSKSLERTILSEIISIESNADDFSLIFNTIQEIINEAGPENEQDIDMLIKLYYMLKGVVTPLRKNQFTESISYEEFQYHTRLSTVGLENNIIYSEQDLIRLEKQIKVKLLPKLKVILEKKPEDAHTSNLYKEVKSLNVEYMIQDLNDIGDKFRNTFHRALENSDTDILHYKLFNPSNRQNDHVIISYLLLTIDDILEGDNVVSDINNAILQDLKTYYQYYQQCCLEQEISIPPISLYSLNLITENTAQKFLDFFMNKYNITVKQQQNNREKVTAQLINEFQEIIKKSTLHEMEKDLLITALSLIDRDIITSIYHNLLDNNNPLLQKFQAIFKYKLDQVFYRHSHSKPRRPSYLFYKTEDEMRTDCTITVENLSDNLYIRQGIFSALKKTFESLEKPIPSKFNDILKEIEEVENYYKKMQAIDDLNAIRNRLHEILNPKGELTKEYSRQLDEILNLSVMPNSSLKNQYQNGSVSNLLFEYFTLYYQAAHNYFTSKLPDNLQLINHITQLKLRILNQSDEELKKLGGMGQSISKDFIRTHYNQCKTISETRHNKLYQSFTQYCDNNLYNVGKSKKLTTAEKELWKYLLSTPNAYFSEISEILINEINIVQQDNGLVGNKITFIQNHLVNSNLEFTQARPYAKNSIYYQNLVETDIEQHTLISTEQFEILQIRHTVLQEILKKLQSLPAPQTEKQNAELKELQNHFEALECSYGIDAKNLLNKINAKFRDRFHKPLQATNGSLLNYHNDHKEVIISTIISSIEAVFTKTSKNSSDSLILQDLHQYYELYQNRIDGTPSTFNKSSFHCLNQSLQQETANIDRLFDEIWQEYDKIEKTSLLNRELLLSNSIKQSLKNVERSHLNLKKQYVLKAFLETLYKIPVDQSKKLYDQIINTNPATAIPTLSYSLKKKIEYFLFYTNTPTTIDYHEIKRFGTEELYYARHVLETDLTITNAEVNDDIHSLASILKDYMNSLEPDQKENIQLQSLGDALALFEENIVYDELLKLKRADQIQQRIIKKIEDLLSSIKPNDIKPNDIQNTLNEYKNLIFFIDVNTENFRKQNLEFAKNEFILLQLLLQTTTKQENPVQFSQADHELIQSNLQKIEDFLGIKDFRDAIQKMVKNIEKHDDPDSGYESSYWDSYNKRNHENIKFLREHDPQFCQDEFIVLHTIKKYILNKIFIGAYSEGLGKIRKLQKKLDTIQSEIQNNSKSFGTESSKTQITTLVQKINNDKLTNYMDIETKYRNALLLCQTKNSLSLLRKHDLEFVKNELFILQTLKQNLMKPEKDEVYAVKEQRENIEKEIFSIHSIALDISLEELTEIFRKLSTTVIRKDDMELQTLLEKYDSIINQIGDRNIAWLRKNDIEFAQNELTVLQEILIKNDQDNSIAIKTEIEIERRILTLSNILKGQNLKIEMGLLVNKIETSGNSGIEKDYKEFVARNALKIGWFRENDLEFAQNELTVLYDTQEVKKLQQTRASHNQKEFYKNQIKQIEKEISYIEYQVQIQMLIQEMVDLAHNISIKMQEFSDPGKEREIGPDIEYIENINKQYQTLLQDDFKEPIEWLRKNNQYFVMNEAAICYNISQFSNHLFQRVEKYQHEWDKEHDNAFETRERLEIEIKVKEVILEEILKITYNTQNINSQNLKARVEQCVQEIQDATIDTKSHFIEKSYSSVFRENPEKELIKSLMKIDLEFSQNLLFIFQRKQESATPEIKDSIVQLDEIQQSIDDLLVIEKFKQAIKELVTTKVHNSQFKEDDITEYEALCAQYTKQQLELARQDLKCIQSEYEVLQVIKTIKLKQLSKASPTLHYQDKEIDILGIKPKLELIINQADINYKKCESYQNTPYYNYKQQIANLACKVNNNILRNIDKTGYSKYKELQHDREKILSSDLEDIEDIEVIEVILNELTILFAIERFIKDINSAEYILVQEEISNHLTILNSKNYNLLNVREKMQVYATADQANQDEIYKDFTLTLQSMPPKMHEWLRINDIEFAQNELTVLQNVQQKTNAEEPRYNQIDQDIHHIRSILVIQTLKQKMEDLANNSKQVQLDERNPGLFEKSQQELYEKYKELCSLCSNEERKSLRKENREFIKNELTILFKAKNSRETQTDREDDISKRIQYFLGLLNLKEFTANIKALAQDIDDNQFDQDFDGIYENHYMKYSDQEEKQWLRSNDLEFARNEFTVLLAAKSKLQSISNIQPSTDRAQQLKFIDNEISTILDAMNIKDEVMELLEETDTLEDFEEKFRKKHVNIIAASMGIGIVGYALTIIPILMDLSIIPMIPEINFHNPYILLPTIGVGGLLALLTVGITLLSINIARSSPSKELKLAEYDLERYSSKLSEIAEKHLAQPLPASLAPLAQLAIKKKFSDSALLSPPIIERPADKKLQHKKAELILKLKKVVIQHASEDQNNITTYRENLIRIILTLVNTIARIESKLSLEENIMYPFKIELAKHKNFEDLEQAFQSIINQLRESGVEQNQQISVIHQKLNQNFKYLESHIPLTANDKSIKEAFEQAHENFKGLISPSLDALAEHYQAFKVIKDRFINHIQERRMAHTLHMKDLGNIDQLYTIAELEIKPDTLKYQSFRHNQFQKERDDIINTIMDKQKKNIDEFQSLISREAREEKLRFSLRSIIFAQYKDSLIHPTTGDEAAAVISKPRTRSTTTPLDGEDALGKLCTAVKDIQEAENIFLKSVLESESLYEDIDTFSSSKVFDLETKKLVQNIGISLSLAVALGIVASIIIEELGGVQSIFFSQAPINSYINGNITPLIAGIILAIAVSILTFQIGNTIIQVINNPTKGTSELFSEDLASKDPVSTYINAYSTIKLVEAAREIKSMEESHRIVDP